MMRCVALARTQRLTRGRRPTGEKRDVCVFAGLRHAVVRLEPIAPAAQLRRVPGGELVAGRQEELRAEALQQGPPALISWQCGTQRADALGGNDRNQARLSGQGERAFVTSRIHFTHSGERVVLVADKQQVTPGACGVGRDLRNALKYRALEI